MAAIHAFGLTELTLFDDVHELDSSSPKWPASPPPPTAPTAQSAPPAAPTPRPMSPTSPTSPTSYPRVIPPQMRARLHNTAMCIDINAAEGVAIKCRVAAQARTRYGGANDETRRGSWTNVVDGVSASIAANLKTTMQNRAVWSGAPVNLLTFSTGADTLYWGKYTCTGGEHANPPRFELKRIDDDERAAELLAGMPTIETNLQKPMYRSRLEKAYADLFESCGYRAVYEPVTLRLGVREYTPDFMVSIPPYMPLLIEIKGAVVDEELELCAQVSALGFYIVLVFGNASEVCDNSCFEYVPFSSKPRRRVPPILRAIAEHAQKTGR